MTVTSAVPSRRHCRRRHRGADAVDAAQRVGDDLGIPERTSVSNGDSGPVPMPEPASWSRPARAGPACASESARGLPSWIVEAATTSAPRIGDRGDGRRPAVAHDDAGPGRPAAAGAIGASGVAPVEPRADRRQDDGQQRDRDGDADERDQHAGDAEAAQERHGQRHEREQRDGDGAAAEDDGAAGVLHGLDDGGLVRGVLRAGAPRASAPRPAARSRSRWPGRRARPGT